MDMVVAFGQTTGQGWEQVGSLALALVLAAAIGLERELRGKSAGLRTHTIIGFAAALIILVSKFGFGDVLGEHVTLDPSRVAAQIVTGVGFIGGGLIFVRRDAVRGLTTAASVWLTTAIGMAAGAGLPVLAVLTTVGFFFITYGLRPLARRLPVSVEGAMRLDLTYLEGRDLLRQVIALCTQGGWTVVGLTTRRSTVEALGAELGHDARRDDPQDISAVPVAVSVEVSLLGEGRYDKLIGDIADLDGVLSVASVSPDDED
jgi:putative Mg2+ transporter-C (MgtC) family protein